jgi:arginase family enzyme
MRLDHLSPIDWSGARPGSFASLLRTEDAEGCRVALIGMPDDTGVRMNRGMPGAAGGPGAFRSSLARYGTAEPAAEAVGAIVDAGLVPVGIGGGHDLTLPFVRAVAERAGAMHGIYLDAHLDVRAEEGSGMPFRRLIEGGDASGLDVIGLDPNVNAREHVEWFRDHGGRIDALTAQGDWPGGPLFMSIDLDSIDASQAPGVSARNPNGLSAQAASAWALEAGRNEYVRCFDIMELCPPNDESGRTARLAAHLFLSFLRGFTERRA